MEAPKDWWQKRGQSEICRRDFLSNSNEQTFSNVEKKARRKGWYIRGIVEWVVKHMFRSYLKFLFPWVVYPQKVLFIFRTCPSGVIRMQVILGDWKRWQWVGRGWSFFIGVGVLASLSGMESSLVRVWQSLFKAYSSIINWWPNFQATYHDSCYIVLLRISEMSGYIQGLGISGESG